MRTLVVPIAEAQVATADVRQLRVRRDGNACVALLLQHRKAHAVQIAHLSLHCGHGFWGLHALHQGGLNLLLEEVLDLLRRDRHAEGARGQRAELLVHEHLAGQAKHGTLDAL